MTGSASEPQDSSTVNGSTVNTHEVPSDVNPPKPADPADDKELKPKTNGHAIENAHLDSVHEAERASKRRRVSEGPGTGPGTPASQSRKKVESPPWKKVAAEGPTSFTIDGRRKSGRVNQIPLELQPPSDKRQTRGAIQKTIPARDKPSGANLSKSQTGASAQRNGNSVNGKRPSSGTGSQAAKAPKLESSPMPKRSHGKSSGTEGSPAPVRSHKKKVPVAKAAPSTNSRSRRSARVSEAVAHNLTNGHDSDAEASNFQSSQTDMAAPSGIRIKINPTKFPVLHPESVLKPKLYPTFREFIEKGEERPIDEGGLLDPEDAERYTDEDALRDAQTLIRIEEETQPGGILSEGVSSIYVPEAQEEPPRQYARQDHMVRAAVEFRKLMVQEQNKHRKNAKMLAKACEAVWKEKQPKTEEELEAEARKEAENRYRTLLKTLKGLWENVRIEVNKRRLAEWEAQEQIRLRKALNEAVDLSTQKLEARMVQSDSEQESDEEEGEDDQEEDDEASGDDGSEDEERESNMSSSESEADNDPPALDATDDANLTVEELRKKYENIPDLPKPSRDDADDVDEVDDDENTDDSDESVDMDDDMGSSDEEDASDDEEDEEDDDEEGPGASSLLGFLPPSDVAALVADRPQSPIPMEIDGGDEGEKNNEEPISIDASVDIPMADGDIPAQSETPAENGSKSQAEGLRKEPQKDQAQAQSVQPDVEMNGEKLAVDDDQRRAEPALESANPSSLPTPQTATETKPSDVDSASSLDLHQNSRHATESATPQPTSNIKTPVPFLLRGTLREYQHYGLDWLAGLYANNTNGILADEMGLGKTIQTIALLAHLACEHEVWGPHLVIVPTSVMLNWEMEFKKWCPGFKIMTYYGSIEERKKKRQGWNQDDLWNVCITSYQLVLQDQQVFKRRRWHYMILDEAHNIKNFRSQRWQTLLTFNTRARLLLTGTPLQNNLTELWSLLFFLMPSDGVEDGVGGFADLKEFSDWFKKPQEQILENGRETMDDEARQIISKLHKVLRPYLLRRMKADVEKQMPAKYEHVEFCRLSRRQRELYDGFLSRSDTRGTLASGNYLSIINCLMQLRKVCNHPDLFQERAITSSLVQKTSIVAELATKKLLVERTLLREPNMSVVSLDFLNMVPSKYEAFSGTVVNRTAELSAHRMLSDLRDAQRIRAQSTLTNLDPSTVQSNLGYLESASRWSRFEELQHCVYLNALRKQQRPIYGRQLLEMLTLDTEQRPFKPKPKKRDQIYDWLSSSPSALRDMIPTLEQRSEALNPYIQRFVCVTPPIIEREALQTILTRKGVSHFQTAPRTSVPDPFHEARMRLSVQFPDKRLLQYDCGKLQTLDRLLRKLQAGGHRALIFTQMTKVLDILEQFLNIHGHKYLRLDGSTKIEQRQILTDRFNNDTRILAFILSSRSGGLGINLTGADTVIFYDLDWNPAMDKQCQDRCHRIGQTRDVHIYRLVSEHTIEANILRKANQKRMLDDVVIQEGEFTTDYFNKLTYRDALGDDADEQLLSGDAAADAAVDRVLGGPGNDNGGGDVRMLEQAEDVEDVAAAKVAQREVVLTDAADFEEKAAKAGGGADTPREDAGTPAANGGVEGGEGRPEIEVVEEQEFNAWGKPIKSMDEYMLGFMSEQLKDAPLELPRDRNRSKRGKRDRARDRHRKR